MTTPDTPARITSVLTVEVDVPFGQPVEDRKTRRWFMPSLLTLTYARTYTDPETEGATSAVTADVSGQPLDGTGRTDNKNKRPLRVSYTDETGFPEGIAEYVDRYSPDKD